MMRLSMPVLALFVLSALAGCGGKNQSANSTYRITVAFPPESGGINVPVTVSLGTGIDLSGKTWEAVPANGDANSAAAPVQMLGPDSIAFLWAPPQGASSQQQEFILRRGGGTAGRLSIEEETPYRLMISEEGKPVIGYVHGMHLADGVPEDRRRASYFHPVHGPDGTVLSDDFPEDHYHHRGIFWTWPQIFVNGDTLSLWDIRGIKQKFEQWIEREAGPVFARLGVLNGWYTEDGDRVVDEQVRATVYRGSELGRMIDFELRWEALSEPVGIQGSADIKGYGGFSIRFAPFEDPQITTTDGLQSEDSNRVPFAWADLSARFAGSQSYSGVTIFDHRDNIDFPNGWCLRHYGFEGIAWPGIEPYWLKPGSPLTARYRVWIHSGDHDSGRISSVYSSWADPAAAVLKTD